MDEKRKNSLWIHCPNCGGKTRTKVYCPKCKKEIIVDVVQLKMVISK